MSDLDIALDHHRAGRLDKAEAIYREILRVAPEHLDALHLLGLVALQRGDHDAAAELIGKAVAANPGVAEFHNSLGNAFKAQGRLDAALESYRRALALKPDLVVPYINLGNTLKAQDKLIEAIASYEQALALEPDAAEVHNNLGIALFEKGDLEGAAAALRRALALKPDQAEACNNLGIVYRALGRVDEALASYDKALELNPGFYTAEFYRGLILLARGEFERGWAGYLARTRVDNTGAKAGEPDFYRRPLPEDLTGNHIFLRKDQGLGDEIFFLRFAPELKNRGARITYQAGAKIASIVGRLPFIDELVADGEMPEAADMALSVGDLPYLLGMKSAADIPPPVDLAPLPERVEAMAAKLAALGPAPYIGVTWRAGVSGRMGKIIRRAPLLGFARLLRPVNGTILALQRGPEAGEIDQLSGGLGRPVHDFTAANEDLEEMLALLSLMDEYVTVSNTNVYLRAGTGRISRVLVPHPPEHRWMAKGTESPWFPGCKLYRQKVDGAWDEALAALARDLKEALGGPGD